MYFAFHVILQNQVIKESLDFMEGNSLLYVTTLPSLLALVIVLVQI